MLTQTSLFAGQDVNQIAHNVANAEPAPPSHVHPGLPQILDFIVARALKKDPAVRYQDAYEMAADLRDALAEMRARLGTPRPASDAEKTQTLRLEAGAERLPVAPPASLIERDTRLPIARLVASDEGLERLAAPRPRDSLAPRRVGFFRRVARDPLPRRLAVASLVAAIVGAWIAGA
jgi:eukaryotic-like serine/threonine-protein kinase